MIDKVFEKAKEITREKALEICRNEKGIVGADINFDFKIENNKYGVVATVFWESVFHASISIIGINNNYESGSGAVEL